MGKPLLLIAVVLLLTYPSVASAYEKAPDFTLTDIDGNTFTLSEQRGKVVLVDFFATWCSPCVEEMSQLRIVRSHFSEEELSMISISVDPDYDTVGRLKQFGEEHNITWPIARDTEGVSDLYDVQFIPTLVIVDQDGYIRFEHVGYTGSGLLINEIENLLAASTTATSPTAPSPPQTTASSTQAAIPPAALVAAAVVLAVAGAAKRRSDEN